MIIIEINIVSSLLESINSIFSSLISSINNNIYTVLDNLLFININIFDHSSLSGLLGSSPTSGIISICNSLVYGFVLYYALSLLLSHLTFAQVQRPSSFIFKIVLCVIALNSCWSICYSAIFVNSCITNLIRRVGESLFNTQICFSTLIENLNSTLYTETTFNLFTFDGLIKAFISIGFVNLAISYSLRYVMVRVFILLCPFAILSLSIDKFSWIFKAWCKIFLSLLFLQILVALILLITFSLKYDPNDFFSQLLYIGSIYALIKANSFLREFMGGLTTDVNFGLSTIKNLIIGGG
ncbi:MAG: hypothetical protein ACI4U9_00265 [Clostridia bacterium]